MTEEQKEKNRQYRKGWYLRNKETVLAKRKVYVAKNREKILEGQRTDKARAYKRERYRANKAKIRANDILWRKANKEKVKAYYKKHKEDNKEKISARDIAWKKAHRKQISAYEKKRNGEDLNLRIKKRLRLRVLHAVQRQSGKKAKPTMELLGCSVASFRIYIESKFQPGMTWNNIHLDHIVPCALFDLKKPEHQKICFHFSNYQPLFTRDNLTKRARLFHQPDHLAL